jgi:hypothetical protein
MFVFQRSLWSVLAGLGTAAGLVVLLLLFENARVPTPLPAPAVASEPHDISLASR